MKDSAYIKITAGKYKGAAGVLIGACRATVYVDGNPLQLKVQEEIHDVYKGPPPRYDVWMGEYEVVGAPTKLDPEAAKNIPQQVLTAADVTEIGRLMRRSHRLIGEAMELSAAMSRILKGGTGTDDKSTAT